MKILTIVIFLFFSAANCIATMPADMFFSPPEITHMVLSPSGTKVIVVKNGEGEQQLNIKHLPSGEENKLLNTSAYSDDNARIQNLTWLDDQYLAIQLAETRKGIEDLLNTKTQRKLLVVDTQNHQAPILRVRTRGWLAHALPNKKDAFLYAKSGTYSKIYQLDVKQLGDDKKKLGKLDKVDGGQFRKSNEIRSVQGYALRWFFSDEGIVKAVLHYDREKKLNLTSFQEDGQYTILKTWNSEDEKNEEKKFVPIAMGKTDGSFYCLDVDEDEERSVYEVNFETGEHTLVHSTQAYSIVDLLLAEDRDLLGVKVVKDGDIQYEYIDDQNNSAGQQDRPLENTLISIFDYSEDGARSLMYTESHDKSGEFYFLDFNDNTKLNIGAIRSGLKDKLDSILIEGTVTVEGLSIPYLLTIPQQKPQQSAYPLIVMPHGGPIGVFDTRYYESRTQFFAANGYAVLRVNFRGSGGYSDEFKEAGKRQWGDKMLLDIYEATRHVALRPDIDAARVCTVGYSYGGYAATMLMIKHPNTYRCAANIAGVSDVNLYLGSGHLTNGQRDWLREYVGDREENYDSIKNISPVYLADKITQPMFVAHGRKDITVDVEHAYRLSLMMEKHDKEHTLYIDDESGHHFSTPEKSILLHEKVIEFVNTNI